MAHSCGWHRSTIFAFRRHTLLPLDDCAYALQATIPHLTRSSLHPHGISRLPDVDGDKPVRANFKAYPTGYFGRARHDGFGVHRRRWPVSIVAAP